MHEVDSLPQVTGVYSFISPRGTILYVGKAKHLRDRVKTYFTNRVHHPRLSRLQREANQIQFLITASELDALLLEDDLIKRHRPSFNRKQKDHHRAVFVRLSHTDPHLSLAIERDIDAIYYGPFKDTWRMKEFIELLADYVGFRRSLLYEDMAERLSLDDKFSVVRAIFEGRGSSLPQRLIKRRNTQSKLLQFESAARTQAKIETVQHIQKWSKLLTQIKRPIDKNEVDRLAILARATSD